MPRRLKDALKAIETYKAASPHYMDLLDILGEILILREEHKRMLTEPVFPVEESLIETKMEGGLPLIDLVSGKFDLTMPKRYFLALLDIAEKRAPGQATEIIRKINDGLLEFETMILGSISAPDEEQEEETEEDGDDDTLDLIELFLEESLRPALEKVAERYGDRIAKAGWSEGYCPVCGREPKIGELKDEEGHRYLFCHQCGFEWSFRRIKCPFCGNEEQQSLAYFTIEGEERYRVDVCNECRRYIKIVDFRETKQEANLDVEDIATLHLDMLANEEGYD
ncbi:MAG: formate dehydrogenase accessory protein FdhE [Deltaproteobacteria bacterium]|nr:formate dehydrogenase accessory protein FdhE [Deltaproteobacteria bacterium]